MKLIDCLREVGLPSIDARRSGEEHERAYELVGNAVVLALETNHAVFEFDIDRILEIFIEESKDNDLPRSGVWYCSAGRYKINPYLKDVSRFLSRKLNNIIEEIVREKFGTEEYSLRGIGTDGRNLRHSRVFYQDTGRMRKYVSSRISLVQPKPIVELKASR
ncbi:MAG TPA: hypothetical protein ENH99_00300 [Candidatus Pacearchaeota archaeon]|nr:hypothetical protein [Candidatus Pacearchaeota archaeon]